MDDKRNLIAAILLSVAILLGWNFVAEKFFPTPDKPDVTKTVAGSSGTVSAGSPAAAGRTDTLPATANAPEIQTIRPLATALADKNRVLIETPKIKGSISLVGARIDDITLQKYRQTIEKDSPPVRLFAPAGTKGAYFANIGWQAQGIAVPGPATLWATNDTTLTPTTPVTLSWANTTGQTFRIEYSIDEDYLITAKQTVANTSTAPVIVQSDAFIARAGRPTNPEDHDTVTIHSGPTGLLDGKSNFTNYDEIEEAKDRTIDFKSVTWMGFTDKYWLSAIIPANGQKASGFFRSLPNNGFQATYASELSQVAPGRQVTTTSRIFAGAKEVATLERYQDQQGITRLSNAIDWGWFEFFAVPIFKLLDWLFRQLGNFGVAIMVLTLIIRLLMFPIANRQFSSMAQMRVVQPKMKALQDRYKDDKPKMQQELMKLYKDEKINPLAGCLPILIQIPIFYALYKVLMLTIEMRHQPFALWIKDLSAPDPLHILNLFGLLPFTPPSILSIGVLAVILGITMWLQFRLNPAPADPVQAQVFKIMPWLFMFIMAPFAAGLLLYWITNNILSIGQQQWMYRKFPALKAAVAK